MSPRPTLIALAALALTSVLHAEELGEMWGTGAEEAKYYPIVNVPIPPGVPMRPGGFDILPDGRLAVGTRRGDIYFIKGAFDSPPQPEYHLFASGQDEIFSLAWKDGAMTTISFGEVTRISDKDGDGVADGYDTLTNNWGYAEGHEFAFASKHDPEGNIWIALGLSGSYESHNLFRGWAVKVTPDGQMIPVCSGLRSPVVWGRMRRAPCLPSRARDHGTAAARSSTSSPAASSAIPRAITGIPSSPA